MMTPFHTGRRLLWLLAALFTVAWAHRAAAAEPVRGTLQSDSTLDVRRFPPQRLFDGDLFASGRKIDVGLWSGTGNPAPPVASPVLVASVQPLPDRLFSPPEVDARTRRLLDACRQAISRWGDVLAGHIVPVPGRQGESYYGLGGNTEDEVRPICYAVMVNGLLWRMEPADASGRRIQQRRDHAVAALRYLVAGHVTGPSTCLNRKQWGDAWQSAMWARAAGVGAWALWDDLDGDLRLAAARMVEHEADRFLNLPPKSSVDRDTGAEENAWNALILSLAANMMPGHPRNSQWDRAARRYMYNVFSVAADAEDDSPGDDGLAVRQWVTTINAHSDFTVENHGLVHVGYQKTSLAQLLENAVHYLIVGREPPAACRHHVAEATELVYRCSAWDGAPVYFGGNDWKLVHTQPTDLPIYSVLSLIAGDRRAALLESRGLEWVARLQSAEGGFFNVRRDLEYGGACATRLAACYLAHAACGAGAEPVLGEEYDRRMHGGWLLEGGRAILHRTPDKFASLAFGPKWLALTVPSGPDRAVWPHFASYLGLVDGEFPTAAEAQTIRLSPPPYDAGFWAVGSLKRCGGRLRHDFAFISPAGNATVYLERLRAEGSFRPQSRETGIVGHEYDVGSNRRKLYGRFGSFEVTGYGGEQKVLELESDWLNLGGRIGYVVRRAPEVKNIVRYHDLAGGTGRVPKLQEWFSLVSGISQGEEWACVVSYPNRSPDETKRLAEGVSLQVEAETARCRVPLKTEVDPLGIEVDFARGAVRVRER